MKIALVALLVIVLAAAAAGGGFYFGNNYGFAQAQNVRNEFFQSRFGAQGGGTNVQGGANGTNAQGANRGQGQGQAQNPADGQTAAFRGANGVVKSVQGDTITLTDRTGNTVTVKLDSKTVIQKTVAGTTADIQAGETITVLSNQTGNNITAQTIQIRPAAQ